jgi:3-dehydroquinate dehydratase-1
VKRIGNKELGDGIPAICVPVMGQTDVLLEKSAEAAAAVPHDVIELRMDSLEYAGESGAAARAIRLVRRILPQDNLLFTFRTEEEGGLRRITEDRYFTMLQEVLDAGAADAVDIEFFKNRERVRQTLASAAEKKVFSVLSSHDFQGTPAKEELVNRLTAMHELGADAAKLACMPKSQEDVFTLMGATAQVKERFPEQLLITMSMGAAGTVSRIAGEADGSCLTFGCAQEASAPGQIEAGELLDMLGKIHIYIHK